MSKSKTRVVDRKDGVATVTLNRSYSLNALNAYAAPPRVGYTWRLESFGILNAAFSGWMPCD